MEAKCKHCKERRVDYRISPKSGKPTKHGYCKNCFELLMARKPPEELVVYEEDLWYTPTYSTGRLL